MFSVMELNNVNNVGKHIESLSFYAVYYKCKNAYINTQSRTNIHMSMCTFIHKHTHVCVSIKDISK